MIKLRIERYSDEELNQKLCDHFDVSSSYAFINDEAWALRYIAKNRLVLVPCRSGEDLSDLWYVISPDNIEFAHKRHHIYAEDVAPETTIPRALAAHILSL